ncbi:hypothetical protein [Streptomyces sp. NPDC001966]
MSPGLPLIAEAIITLSSIQAFADLDPRRIEDRLADYLDGSEGAVLLSGSTAVHRLDFGPPWSVAAPADEAPEGTWPDGP